MDSLTQAALGAAVGHLCWQEKLGRKSLLPGAIIGTLPDLDILLYPLLDGVQQLYWHRGESHSIWFILLGALAIGKLLRLTSFAEGLDRKRVITGVFLILLTHVLIDLFTVYGTQLLAPISREGFALNNMFIIDPLFTAILLTGVLGACFLRQKSVAAKMNRSALLLLTLYAAWSLTIQAIAHQRFGLALEDQGYNVSRRITSASPFNTLLWRHIAEVPGGYIMAYWSILDNKNRQIQFQFIPQNKEYVEQLQSTRAFQAIAWFSKGWWFTVKSGETTVRVVDLRFTEIPSAKKQSYTQWQWPFSWHFDLEYPQDDKLVAIRPELENPAHSLKLLKMRVLGQTGWLNRME